MWNLLPMPNLVAHMYRVEPPPAGLVTIVVIVLGLVFCIVVLAIFLMLLKVIQHFKDDRMLRRNWPERPRR